MDIQIFGTKKDFDTRKAGRYFKESGIKAQFIDMKEKGIYISEEDKIEKILKNQKIIKTPIVRNGKLATVGYQPDVWKGWK